jgi:predicted AlkP superfamily pyrophosphatase or phosphodiesterase
LHKTAVLNVVGLTPSLLGDAMPALTAWARGGVMARIKSAFPAVTCSAQSDYLTGSYPETHGIVGNGRYAREDAEIRYWKQ